MPMSLKEFAEQLGFHFNMTHTAVYDRQRQLVSAGLLVGDNLRGPGNGIRVTPRNVAVMVLSILVADRPSESPAKTALLMKATTTDGQPCALTGATTLLGAVSTLMGDQLAALRTIDLTVSRTAAIATLAFRNPRQTAELPATVFRGKGQSEADMRVLAILDGNAIEALCSDVIAQRPSPGYSLTFYGDVK